MKEPTPQTGEWTYQTYGHRDTGGIWEVVYRADLKCYGAIRVVRRLVTVGHGVRIRQHVEWWAAPKYASKKVDSPREAIEAIRPFLPEIPPALVARLWVDFQGPGEWAP